MDDILAILGNSSDNNSNTTSAPDHDLPHKVNELQILLMVIVAWIMIGVGISIDRELFVRLATNKRMLMAASIVCFCQSIMMPLLGFVLAKIFVPDEPFVAFGFIITSSVPGGAISNAFNALSNNVLELSVFTSCASTVLSFGTSPLFTYLYAGLGFGLSSKVDFGTLAIGFVALIIPLGIGVGIHKLWPARQELFLKIIGITTGLGCIAVVVILIGGFGSGNVSKSSLKDANWKVWVPATCILSPAVILLSYSLCRLFGYSPAIARTCVLESLCQNVGLTYASIELSIRHNNVDRNQAFQFALIYSISQYLHCAYLIPLMRWQHAHNKHHHIDDLEPEIAALWEKAHEAADLLNVDGDGEDGCTEDIAPRDDDDLPGGGGGGEEGKLTLNVDSKPINPGSMLSGGERSPLLERS